MTTGTLSFYPTANTIVNGALKIIRGIDSVQGPTTQQTVDGLEALNFLLTSWQTLGLQLWCIKTSSALTLILNQAKYTIGTGGQLAIARPVNIIQGWIRDTIANTDMPLNELSMQQYNSLSNKFTASTPNSFYFDAAYGADGTPNLGASAKANLYIWPPADANAVSGKSLMLVYSRPFIDFDAATDTIDMPQEWYNALKWNLAAQIMTEYGIPFMDQDRINARAEKELNQCLGWDAEKVSLNVRPDQRAGFK